MPYSKEAKFEHHRQEKPGDFDKETFRNVPLSHTDYKGKKFDKDKDRAVVGKERGWKGREKKERKSEKIKLEPSSSTFSGQHGEKIQVSVESLIRGSLSIFALVN